MKTPYDPAIRLSKHAVDVLRISMSTEMIRIAQLDAEAKRLQLDVSEECLAAQDDWYFSTYNWVRSRKQQAEVIAQNRDESEMRLNRLREEASAAYAKLSAAEDAASHFRQQERRKELGKAQSASDDLANARRLIAARKAERKAG